MILKRICAMLLCASLACALASCGEYKGALEFEEESTEAVTPGGALDDDPTNDFTVTLRLNGKPYKPSVGLDVYWSDGYDIYIAPFGEDGVARIDGLDGDYHVTLSAVPAGYAYDANSYVATNLERNVTLDLYDLNSVSGKGSGLYSCYRLNETGIYSVTISEEGEQAFFEFAPQINGTYTVESWASVTEDEVNPIAVAYYGTTSYKHSPYTVDEVSTVGSFTRNFLHTVKIADQNISGGGSQTFTFALSAQTKSGVYPVTFTFAIKRDGAFDMDSTVLTMIPVKADLSHFDFDAFNAMAGGTIVGAETLYRDKDGNEKEGAYIFDESNYRIWEISDGGDGVYHVYDEEKYASTGGYGPVLVAYISEPCRFVDSAFTIIESFGNKALTVNGTENYKQFIEGWEALASGGFYCLTDCPCHPAEEVNRACVPDCPTCDSRCTPCPEEMMGKDGYVAWCNTDGVAPVTKELAEFLQKFSVSQRYFADGDGWAERKGIHAYEESQWLFACGYYQ